ncbi:MAG: hypothetical protein K2N74_02120 [Clostridiales bacterium]|nr:hypothetical protein [Clostridiales bacterium]
MKKRLKRIYRTCAVFLSLFVIIFALLLGVFIADYVTEDFARVLPSYEKTDISELIYKEEWTEEDYDVLYHQTGLGKAALDDMKSQRARLLVFQEAFFYEGELEHQQVTFTTKQDKLKDYTAPMVDLHAGDVIVSSTCHTMGWRNGHAALVIDSVTLLESISLGTPSTLSTGGIRWFRTATNFIVLRLKKDNPAEAAQEGKRIADLAKEQLNDVPYSLTVGIFSKKDQGANPKATHCSHLVWQAFYNCGYDVDANGGGLCTARDIARSPLFEVIQVYGFDPEKLW